jgi:serine protease Do
MLIVLLAGAMAFLPAASSLAQDKPAKPETPRADAPKPASGKPAEPPGTEPKTEKPQADPAKEQTRSEPKKEEPKQPDPKPEPKKDDPAKPIKSALPRVDNAAWLKPSPQTLADLQQIQDRVQAVARRAIPWTVGLRIGGASGSGVIISKDGYVLTAGHVSAQPGRPVQIILHDGKIVQGKTLGRNAGIDSGLVKIDGNREWDHAEMGESSSLKQGEWCIAIGHPGGYMNGRPPVVRLGRVASVSDRVVWTDCTLVGGDSGGPLFDMDGKVIAIHSRIGAPTDANFHVPVDTYRATWDRLASAEDWSDSPASALGAIVGLNAESHEKGALVTGVTLGFPAASAGIRTGDIITRFGSRAIANANDLVEAIRRRKAQDQADIELLRDGKIEKVKVTLIGGVRAGPFLGVSGADNPKGLIIDSIVPDAPAARVGLKKDDIIAKFDGQDIKDINQLQTLVGKRKAGDAVEIEIVRGDKTIKEKLTLAMRG